MWPFSRKSREQRIAECDHKWEEYETVMTHPQNIYHEDGTPFIHKLVTRGRECQHCPKTERIEQSEKKIYLEISRVEEVEHE